MLAKNDLYPGVLIPMSAPNRPKNCLSPTVTLFCLWSILGLKNATPRGDPSIPNCSQLSMTLVTKYGQQKSHQPELPTD